MKVGCHLPTFGEVATRRDLLTFASRVEALGYDSVWASDHVVVPFEIGSRYPYNATGQFPLPPTTAFLEPLTALAMVGAATERVALGTSILVLPHRHPVLAAKMLATLDHLAPGRVILGVGVGWMREEIALLGAPFDERGEWSDEAIRVMRTCWRDERAEHHGRFFDFDPVGVFPKPARRDIPVWIGGQTPRALRRAARLGDGWHAAFATPQELEKDLAALRAECAQARRSLTELTISVRIGVPGKKPTRELATDLERFRALGVGHVVLETRYRDVADMLATYDRIAAEALPAVTR